MPITRREFNAFAEKIAEEIIDNIGEEEKIYGIENIEELIISVLKSLNPNFKSSRWNNFIIKRVKAYRDRIKDSPFYTGNRERAMSDIEEEIKNRG